MTVTVTYSVRAFFGNLGAYTYGVPQKAIVPLDDIEAQFLNLDTAEVLTNVGAQVEITDPNGVVTTLTATADEILPNETDTLRFDSYTPSDVGVYQLVYTNDLNNDSLFGSFEITDYTFKVDQGPDAGNICTWPEDCWFSYGYPYQGFIDNNLRYDIGNVYFTGDETATATHATFSIANADSLYTGDAESDLFTIILYDIDGVTGDEDSYEEFVPVGFTSYSLTGEEDIYGLITVPFEDAIELDTNSTYMLMVQYDGLNAGLAVPAG